MADPWEPRCASGHHVGEALPIPEENIEEGDPRHFVCAECGELFDPESQGLWRELGGPSGAEAGGG